MSTEPSTPSLLEQLVESFMDRQRRGERPSVEEYVRNHPELASQLRDVLPALELMEEFGSAGPVTGPYRPQERDFGAVPPQLGEFRILREIGRGGMGVVYEAVQGSLGRHVALKVLPHQLGTNEVFLERFRREAKAAAGLHHTSIVPVFGVGEHDGLHYYAMQYIRGQTLESVLRELRRFRHGDRASPADRAGGELSAVSRTVLSGRFETNRPKANGGEEVPRAEPLRARSPPGGSSRSGR